MILLYNICQLILLPILALPLILVILCVPKYRMRSLHRLGWGIKGKSAKNKKQKTIWIHALSVGEVTSALPLVAGLRKELPDAELVFSASSKEGAKIAQKLLHDKIDHFLPFPFDFLPVIHRVLHVVQPDLFILVETDFWPNILSTLQRKGIPTLLVNGRISVKSIRSYQRLRFFFKPLFASFQTLSMQTEADRQNLLQMGLPEDKVKTLGNLKLDTALYSANTRKQPLSFTLPEHSLLLVAGSTHEGEEAIILQSYKELKTQFPACYLVIAPRDVTCGAAIQTLAAGMDIEANRRSQINAGGRDLFILDSIGELNSVYSHAHVAFVGGSLVPKGGHNPIEPAIFSIPVLFGHHMEDFSEIAEELLQTGGGIMVRNQSELTAELEKFFRNPQLLQTYGAAAKICILAKQGVIQRHIHLVKEML